MELFVQAETRKLSAKFPLVSAFRLNKRSHEEKFPDKAKQSGSMEVLTACTRRSAKYTESEKMVSRKIHDVMTRILLISTKGCAKMDDRLLGAKNEIKKLLRNASSRQCIWGLPSILSGWLGRLGSKERNKTMVLPIKSHIGDIQATPRIYIWVHTGYPENKVLDEVS